MSVRAANGPTTPSAEKTLNRNNAVAVPGILANSGRVFVSCFERVQNLDRDHWSDECINQRVSKMKAAFGSVFDRTKRKGIDLRMAALSIAAQRVVAAMKLGGWH